ncbi:acetyl/propionyl/methylcrotonyl-CoA carboxylase subunit alpha, partial [Streptomyces sp. NPDC058953]|uniref:acetyl-CoA carboxylase biotin carboxylase subunit n=1 Tax=Streptomyces sp. NPDC058953 TaxID=3346676 RepID=UPI00367EEF73
MITCVLVANRGEIARRIFRTCRELGITTVAVYADPDADALHVREADAAVRLPGAAPSETYLRGDLIVKAALAAGADAVHPGYGFLAENAGFARAVEDAGLLWVGPPPAAIGTLASKTRAKELMGAVPLAPETVTEADLPVLVKAAAGGGGRGMRIVRELAARPGELTAASAEARSAFGDGEVFVEPYVERGRHVEVQLLADRYGTVWTLGTRDCSVQRRHQKVIEECPAPGLPDAFTAGLAASSAALARRVGYTGAGTVEFLVTEGPEGPRAQFLEMNTRLQVEHPVTELVHGVDLVALQFAIAEGERLPPEPPAASGHAIEARLYAEDPARGGLPQAGPLHELRFPEFPEFPEERTAGGTVLRIDSGYGPGGFVPVPYDPLLAKVIVRAPTRAAAVRRLADALRRTVVHGPVTNRELLVRALTHPEFAEGPPDTGFLARRTPELTRPVPGEEAAAVAAALAAAARRRGGSVPRRIGGWRNLPSQPHSAAFTGGDGTTVHEVRYRYGSRDGDGFTVDELPGLPGPPGLTVVSVAADLVALEVDGVVRRYAVRVHDGAGRVHVDGPTGSFTLTERPRFPDPETRAAPGALRAPLPGPRG